MVRRRGRYYPLAAHKGESWCVVSDRTTRVIGWTHYPAGTNLERLFAEITREVIEAGWMVEEHLSWMGSFYCHQKVGTTRLLVHLQPTAPANPLSEWKLPTGSTCIADCLQLGPTT
jgi:hypothetical protein